MLPGERDFADGAKFRLLRWGNDLGLSRWAWYNHKGPCPKERGGTERAGAVAEVGGDSSAARGHSLGRWAGSGSRHRTESPLEPPAGNLLTDSLRGAPTGLMLDF